MEISGSSELAPPARVSHQANKPAPAGVNLTKVPLSWISKAPFNGELHACAVLCGSALVAE